MSCEYSAWKYARPAGGEKDDAQVDLPCDKVMRGDQTAWRQKVIIAICLCLAGAGEVRMHPIAFVGDVLARSPPLSIVIIASAILASSKDSSRSFRSVWHFGDPSC